MSSPSPSRPNFTSIVAACILSGGLIASAIINSRKPAPVIAPGGVVVSAEGRAVLPTPPISKESMTAQVTAQLMASPQLQSVTSDVLMNGGDPPPLQKAGKSVCKLMGVTVDQIQYDAKDDTFFVVVSPTYQTATGKNIVTHDYFTFRNDGYNNYIDEYYLRGTANNATGAVPEVHLTVH